MCGSSITDVAGSNGTAIKQSIISAPQRLVRQGGRQKDRRVPGGTTRKIVAVISSCCSFMPSASAIVWTTTWAIAIGFVRADRTGDQHDAYSFVGWLKSNFLKPLTTAPEVLCRNAVKKVPFKILTSQSALAPGGGGSHKYTRSRSRIAQYRSNAFRLLSRPRKVEIDQPRK
jgi:hypothetical protein